MDILDELYKLDDNELEEYVNSRIDYLEEKSIKDNKIYDYIGFNINNSPTIIEGNIRTNNIYYGYIPLCTKVIYGMFLYDYSVSNNGCYYYIDTNDYILDFIKEIRTKPAIDDLDLFDRILFFLRKYFGYVKLIERVQMDSLILKEEYEYYDLIDEHKLSDFIGKGNAVCTEYSVVAQNILSFLGYDTVYLIGLNNVNNHAFNLISYNDSNTNEEKNILIDFKDTAEAYDINFNKRYESPFIYELDKSILEEIEDLSNGAELLCDDYMWQVYNKTIYKMYNNNIRNYSVCASKVKSFYF